MRIARHNPKLAASLLLACTAVAWLPACAAERETTLMRSARAREAAAMQDERERQLRDLAVLQQTREDVARALAEANTAGVAATSHLRAVRADLSFRLGQVVHAEHDLAAVQQRALEIERQLVPLRALETTLQQQERLRAEAQQQLAALEVEVAAAVAAATQQEAALRPRLAAAQQRLERIQQAGKSLAAAEASIAEALAAPAPAAPAPAPAPVTPKK